MVKDNGDPPRPYSHTFVHGSLWCVDRAYEVFTVSTFRRATRFYVHWAMHMAGPHIYARVGDFYIYMSPVLCTNPGPKGSSARTKRVGKRPETSRPVGVGP
jgi:hypothetical protein